MYHFIHSCDFFKYDWGETKVEKPSLMLKNIQTCSRVDLEIENNHKGVYFSVSSAVHTSVQYVLTERKKYESVDEARGQLCVCMCICEGERERERGKCASGGQVT